MWLAYPLTRKETQSPQGHTARNSELEPDPGYRAPFRLSAHNHVPSCVLSVVLN